MRYGYAFFLCLISIGFFGFAARARAAGEPALDLTLGTATTRLTLGELRAKLPVVTVAIDDPVVHAKKSYDGFEFLDVLRLVGWKPETTADEIVFTSLDGYAPNATFATVRAHRAVLAFQEHGTSLKFGTVAQGKGNVPLGPFYLVWAEGDAVGDAVPWPYQLAKIEVVRFAERYAAAFPTGAPAGSSAMRGFAIFRERCIRCHSVNLLGGEIGPELNVPQNVTEYWAVGTLRKFISDASKFRAKSKMPPFRELGEKGVADVVGYLEFMRARKQGG